MWLVAPLLALLCLLPAVRLVHLHLLRPERPARSRTLQFRFEIPKTARSTTRRAPCLFELAREYRPRRLYDEVPPVLRDAILAAEDMELLHPLRRRVPSAPRVFYKTIVHSVAAWWNGDGFSAAFPHGGSTSRSMLVRVTSSGTVRVARVAPSVPRHHEFAAPLHGPWVSGHEQASRKLEEIRLSIWLEQRWPALRFAGAGQARDLRPSSILIIWATAGTALPRPRVLLPACPCRATRPGCRERSIAGGHHQVPRDYARCRDPDPCAGATNPGADGANGYITADAAKRSTGSRSSVATRHDKTQAPAAINTFSPS